MNQKKLLSLSGGLLFMMGFWMMVGYNDLAERTLLVNRQWLELELVYQQRFSLLPGLLEIDPAILVQQPELVSRVAKARANFVGAETTNQKVVAIHDVEQNVQQLQSLIASKPGLSTSVSLHSITTELATTEPAIKREESEYNSQVEAYNRFVTSFPMVVLAKIFNFPIFVPFTMNTAGST